MEFTIVKKPKKTRYNIKKPGKYIYFLHNCNGSFHIRILDQGINVYIIGLFTGQTSDRFKLNTIQEHAVGGSQSDLYIRGVFEDKSSLIYNGYITIAKDSQQTKACQKNKTLLLSRYAKIDCKPYLEIMANDVICTHASTTAPIDSDQISFLKTKGLSQKKAKDLIKKGFINSAFERLTDLGVDRKQIARIKRDVFKYML